MITALTAAQLMRASYPFQKKHAPPGWTAMGNKRFYGTAQVVTVWRHDGNHSKVACWHGRRPWNVFSVLQMINLQAFQGRYPKRYLKWATNFRSLTHVGHSGGCGIVMHIHKSMNYKGLAYCFEGAALAQRTTDARPHIGTNLRSFWIKGSKYGDPGEHPPPGICMPLDNPGGNPHRMTTVLEAVRRLVDGS